MYYSRGLFFLYYDQMFFCFVIPVYCTKPFGLSQINNNKKYDLIIHRNIQIKRSEIEIGSKSVAESDTINILLAFATHSVFHGSKSYRLCPDWHVRQSSR